MDKKLTQFQRKIVRDSLDEIYGGKVSREARERQASDERFYHECGWLKASCRLYSAFDKGVKAQYHA